MMNVMSFALLLLAFAMMFSNCYCVSDGAVSVFKLRSELVSGNFSLHSLTTYCLFAIHCPFQSIVLNAKYSPLYGIMMCL